MMSELKSLKTQTAMQHLAASIKRSISRAVGALQPSDDIALSRDVPLALGT
jgi:hypothetical protein